MGRLARKAWVTYSRSMRTLGLPGSWVGVLVMAVLMTRPPAALQSAEIRGHGVPSADAAATSPDGGTTRALMPAPFLRHARTGWRTGNDAEISRWHVLRVPPPQNLTSVAIGAAGILIAVVMREVACGLAVTAFAALAAHHATVLPPPVLG